MCLAIPGRVVAIGEPATGSLAGRVAYADREMDVNLVMVPSVEIGQHVIVHSGFAIRVVNDDEMSRVRELFD